MGIKLFYSSHAIDPELVESDKLPFFMGAVVPDHFAFIVQKVYLASIVRMQQALTESMVRSLNAYTQTGVFKFEEKEVVDLKGEIDRCRLIMQHTLREEDYALLERDSIRAVLEDLLVIVRKQVMSCFTQTFNGMTDAIADSMQNHANVTSQCILTFANVLSKNKREIN